MSSLVTIGYLLHIYYTIQIKGTLVIGGLKPMDTKKIVVIGVFILLVVAVLMMVTKTRSMVSPLIGKVPVVGGLASKIPTAF